MLVAADSSAIVKLVLDEEGSDLARLVWAEADTILASRLARVEASAAVAAAQRARRIGRAGEARAHEELESAWSTVGVHELDQKLEQDALGLVRAHAISGADGIHLAAAVGTGATLLTWDRRLAAAASAEGLDVIPHG